MCLVLISDSRSTVGLKPRLYVLNVQQTPLKILKCRQCTPDIGAMSSLLAPISKFLDEFNFEILKFRNIDIEIFFFNFKICFSTF